MRGALIIAAVGSCTALRRLIAPAPSTFFVPPSSWTFLRALPAIAKQELETAITLNPSYAIAHYSLGWVAMQLGERDLCLERIGWAPRLSPYDPLKFAMLSVTALNLALMDRTAEAAALAARSTVQPGAHWQSFAFAAVCHAMDGQRDRARALYTRVRAASPRYDVNDFLLKFPFSSEADARKNSRSVQAPSVGEVLDIASRRAS